LRAEFVVPHAQDRSFFYGLNFELSFKAGTGSRPAIPARSAIDGVSPKACTPWDAVIDATTNRLRPILLAASLAAPVRLAALRVIGSGGRKRPFLQSPINRTVGSAAHTASASS
jgi:hypothetical protein